MGCSTPKPLDVLGFSSLQTGLHSWEKSHETNMAVTFRVMTKWFHTCSGQAFAQRRILGEAVREPDDQRSMPFSSLFGFFRSG